MKFIYAFGLVVSSYLLYKYKQKSQKLLLVHSNNRLSLLFHMINSKYFESFKPTLFLFSGHAQTFFVELFNILLTFLKNILNFYNFKYKRQIFTLSDGSNLAVDIARKRNRSKDKSSYEYKKLLLIFPGVTSTSDEYYIKSLIEDFCDEFDCRVLNARGFEIKATSPKLISTGCYKDVGEFIIKTAEENKNKKIFGLGFSFGGMLLARFLGAEPDKVPKNFLAACGLCYPCCLEQAKNYGELHFNGLYSKPSLKNLKQIFYENLDVMFDKKFYVDKNDKNFNNIHEIKEKILKEVEGCRVLSDFDRVWTIRMLEFENINDYYSYSKLEPYISKIKVPFLSMFTEDDPIIPINSIPFKTLQNNPNTVTAVTQNGGHLGFFGGIIIPQRIVDQPIRTFFKTVEILKDTSNCNCEENLVC